MQHGKIALSNYYQTLIDSFTGTSPCGSSLEYDSTFILMQSRLQPRLGAEYGDFVENAEPVNWSEIERDCRSLLQKCIDVRLIILLMRCRMRQNGPLALEEGLEALTVLLARYPDDIHPQLIDEGEYEPLLRANAFSELDDGEGFLADVRNLSLPNSIGLTLSIKDYEKSHFGPRDESSLAENTITSLKQAWGEQHNVEILSLATAENRLRQLRKLIISSSGNREPDFTRLEQLLELFSQQKSNPVIRQPVEEQHEPNTAVDISTSSSPLVALPVTDVTPSPLGVNTHATTLPVICNRQEALNHLREIRDWFSATEPGSPVILLLAFAEKTIGKSFAELIRYIPMDMVSQLESDKE